MAQDELKWSDWSVGSRDIPVTGKTGPVLGICTPHHGHEMIEEPPKGEIPGPTGMKRRGNSASESVRRKGRVWNSTLD